MAKKNIETMSFRELLNYKDTLLENDKWLDLNLEKQKKIDNILNKGFKNTKKELHNFFKDLEDDLEL